MSEPTKIVERITGGLVDLFSKSERGGNKIKTFLSLVAIIFIVIPIVFHFLALQEIQIQANIIAELSSTEVSELSPELLERHDLLIDKCANGRLWINDINSSVKSCVEKLTKDAVSLYQTEISGWFQYVGFGFKPDVFRPVLLWNLIPLALLSVLVLVFLILEYNQENFGFKKVLYPFLWGIGILIVVGIYSTVLAYVLSLLCPVIFFTAAFTIGMVVLFSLIITAFIIWTLSSVF